MTAISDLKFACTVLDGLRFAGLDQNPHGIRDVLYSAFCQLERDAQAPTDDTVELLAKALALDMYPDTRWPRDDADANNGVADRQGRHPVSWHFANKCRSQARVAIGVLATPTSKEGE